MPVVKILKSILQSLFATVVFLFILEGACRLAGLPRGANSYYERIIFNEKLSVHKPADEFRIFAYGESTMHGSHYNPASNPARWLEAYLKEFLPGKKIRVVNFARMGLGSRRTYRAFRDTVDYKPDLAIFYMGHNSFLPGNRKDQVEKEEGRMNYKLKAFTRESRLISAVYSFSLKFKRPKKEQDDSIEYPKIESLPGGMGPENSIPNTDPAYQDNIQFSKENLTKILDLAESRKIKAIFFKPVSNLKDFSPFMSVHMTKLSPEELKKWEDLFGKGKAAQAEGRTADAMIFYEAAYAMDPTYAELCFNLGRLYFQKGDLVKAKKLFEDARDYDTIKVRASKEMLKNFDDLQKTKGMQVIDTEKLIVAEVPGGIPGEPVIEDNVHFSVKGHSLLGRGLAEEIANRNWIAPRDEWQFNRERPFEEIAKDLGVNPEMIFTADLRMVFYFGRRFDNRIRFAQMALAIHPEDPKALRHLAWSYWLAGEQAKALEVYTKLNQTHPEALQEVFQNSPEVQASFNQKAAVKPAA